MTLFVTELDTSGNLRVVIPNAQVWGSPTINYSINDTRRCDFVIGVGYEDDIEQALLVIRGVIEADDRAMGDPEPFVAVTGRATVRSRSRFESGPPPATSSRCGSIS